MAISFILLETFNNVYLYCLSMHIDIIRGIDHEMPITLDDDSPDGKYLHRAAWISNIFYDLSA